MVKTQIFICCDKCEKPILDDQICYGYLATNNELLTSRYDYLPYSEIYLDEDCYQNIINDVIDRLIAKMNITNDINAEFMELTEPINIQNSSETIKIKLGSFIRIQMLAYTGYKWFIFKDFEGKIKYGFRVDLKNPNIEEDLRENLRFIFSNYFMSGPLKSLRSDFRYKIEELKRRREMEATAASCAVDARMNDIIQVYGSSTRTYDMI